MRSEERKKSLGEVFTPTEEWAVYYEDVNNSSWRVTDHSRSFFEGNTEFTSIMSDSIMLNLYLKYPGPLDRWRTG